MPISYPGTAGATGAQGPAGADGAAASISDTAYDATSWNGVTTVAPSKNAVRDMREAISGGSVSLATPTGTVNGVNDDFVFASPPIVVFRNGLNETRLGTIATNTFTFDSPPETGDDIEGLV